jgi:hypothetical protein
VPGCHAAAPACLKIFFPTKIFSPIKIFPPHRTSLSLSLYLSSSNSSSPRHCSFFLCHCKAASKLYCARARVCRLLCSTMLDRRAPPQTQAISILMLRWARGLHAPLASPHHAPHELLVELTPHNSTSCSGPRHLCVPCAQVAFTRESWNSPLRRASL